MDNEARSPSKPDPRQRLAGPLFRAIGPLVRFVLRRGLGEPNVLLTVRGRVTGEPRSTPVAMWELGDRRFVQASFGGEVNWVRNIRASGEAVIRRGGWSLAVHATELAPAEAGRLMHDALAGFHRRRLARFLLGPTVRPPAAILHRYRFQVDDDLGAYVAEARRAPLFELVPREPTTTGHALVRPGAR